LKGLDALFFVVFKKLLKMQAMMGCTIQPENAEEF